MSNEEMTSTPVTRFLDELEVPFRFFRHPSPVDSLDQAARERGQRPEQIIRSIVFRLSRGGFVMVLVAPLLSVTFRVTLTVWGEFVAVVEETVMTAL